MSLLRWFRETACDHFFKVADMRPRGADGMVRWPCAKCGHLFIEPFGLAILRHGKCDGRWGEPPTKETPMNVVPPDARQLATWAIKTYGLQPLWDLIKITSPFHVKYHNVVHMHNVAGFAVWLGMQNGVSPKLTALAGIMHDYQHQGADSMRHDGTTDNENVQRALAHLSVFASADYRPAGLGEALRWPSGLIGEVLPEEYNAVKRAIATTEYDSVAKVFPTSPLDLDQEIAIAGPLAACLRDADLSTIFLPANTAGLLLAGLYYEMTNNAEKPMSAGQFWEANLEFLFSAKWYTEQGKALSRQIENRAKGVLPWFTRYVDKQDGFWAALQEEIERI